MHSVIYSAVALEQMVDDYLTHDEFVFDIESVGEFRGDPLRNEVTFISFATDDRVDVLPLGPHPIEGPEQFLWPTEAYPILKRLFFDKKIRKVGHNLKFDLESVEKYLGAFPCPPYADTLMAAFLLDENLPRYRLGDLGQKYLGVTYDKSIGKKGVDQVPFQMAAEYSGLDAQTTWGLWQYLKPRLTENKVAGVYRLEMDVLEVLLSMEKEGVLIDVPLIKGLDDQLVASIAETKTKLFDEAGQVFNLNSSQQKAKILYEVMGLKPRKFTAKGAPSTDEQAISPYRAKNKVVDLMLTYQEQNKFHSTYVKGLSERLYPDNKLHADFVQHGAATGRFSCRNPNLQNIPRPDSDLGKRVRGLFIASPGMRLVVADYSQIELRVLAHFCRDEALVQTFELGIDAHTGTAAKMYGVEPSDVTKDQRQNAKNSNFATVYGASAKKLAQTAGVSEEEAQQFLKLHRKMFPSVYRWKDEVIRDARRTKEVRTIFGRTRHLPELNSATEWKRFHAERQAVNTVIQGSSADIIKLAMVRLHSMLPSYAKLLLTIHDELVVEAPFVMVDEVKEIMVEAMLGIDLLTVPLETEAKDVQRWSEAK